MTYADQYQAAKRPDYKDHNELLDLILEVDEHSQMALEDGRVYIKFSDGSKCRMGDAN